MTAAEGPRWGTAGVAAVLHVSPRTVRRMAARGELAATREGGALRFPEAAVRGFLTAMGLGDAYVTFLLDRARPGECTCIRGNDMACVTSSVQDCVACR